MTEGQRGQWRSPRGPRGEASERLALQPLGALRIKRVERFAFETGQVALDVVADLGLQIGEVTITFRELRKQRGIERERDAGIDRVEPVLLVDVPRSTIPQRPSRFSRKSKRGPCTRRRT